MKILPKGRLGIWSVGLTILVLLLLSIFFAFRFLDLVSFDEGHWWDFTVGFSVLVELIAFILSIIALRKTKDHSVLTYLSFIIGICAILFLFLHSIFINE